MCWNPDTRRVDARAPAIVGNRMDHYVQIFFPIINTVLTDDDLAQPGAVNLDALIVAPKTSRRCIAEDNATLTTSQNLSGAGVIGWIETEGFARRAGANEGLNDSVRSPGIGAAGFKHQRNFQRHRRNPERMYAGRVAWQDDPQRFSARIETQGLTFNFAKPLVQYPPINISGQTVEHVVRFCQHALNLAHVLARQHMRHSRGRRDLADISFRHLLVVSERQRSGEKMAGSSCTDLDKFRGGKRGKLSPARFLISEIAPNQAAVGLADLNEQLARLVVWHARDIQAFVSLTLAEYGNVNHCLNLYS